MNLSDMVTKGEDDANNQNEEHLNEEANDL